MSSTVPGAEAEASGSSQPSEPEPERPQADSPQRDLRRPELLAPAPAPAPDQETGAQPLPAARAAEAAEESLPAPSAARKVRLRRTRRFFRRPTVRVVSALIGVFVIWVAVSAGQATFQNNGQGAAANLAESMPQIRKRAAKCERVVILGPRCNPEC